MFEGDAAIGVDGEPGGDDLDLGVEALVDLPAHEPEQEEAGAGRGERQHGDDQDDGGGKQPAGERARQEIHDPPPAVSR